MKALVVTLLASLVFAVSAFATPRLEVGEGAVVGSPASVFVGYGQAKTDPAPSRIVIAVPSAYAFMPHADGATPGTWIGTDVVQLSPQVGPNLATGLLTMEDPAAFGAEALVCTGRSGHDAVWAARGSPGGHHPPSPEMDGARPRGIRSPLGALAGRVTRPRRCVEPA